MRVSRSTGWVLLGILVGAIIGFLLWRTVVGTVVGVIVGLVVSSVLVELADLYRRRRGKQSKDAEPVQGVSDVGHDAVRTQRVTDGIKFVDRLRSGF